MPRTKPEPVETLRDFLEWAGQFNDGTYVFRGVPNDEYEIQASAYRRVPENDQNSEDKGFPTFVEINMALIREVRLRGYDQKDGRSLSDLEILAALQHFKAAICLIDFTYRAQVALWFACGQDSKTPDSTNGKVFAVHKDADRFIEIEPDSFYQRGLAKAELRQYDAAIADYDAAIRLSPNDEFIYDQRELVKAQQEQYEMET